jgi:hypothetical protein
VEIKQTLALLVWTFSLRFAGNSAGTQRKTLIGQIDPERERHRIGSLENLSIKSVTLISIGLLYAQRYGKIYCRMKASNEALNATVCQVFNGEAAPIATAGDGELNA